MYDGIWEKAHDPAFIKNATVDETKAALKAGGLTDAHVPITFTVTAVVHAQGLVLFDSGTGAQLAPTAGNITKNNLWKAAGIDPAKVTNIVITPFPRRSHHRVDGQGHQRADLPQGPDPRVGHRVQVLDQSHGHGRRCQAHPGGVSGLEATSSSSRARSRWRRA